MPDLHDASRTEREQLDQSELSPEEVVRLREGIDARLAKRPALWPKLVPVLGAAVAGVAVAALGIVPRMSDGPGTWAEVAQGSACVSRSAGELQVREDCETPVMVVVADAGKVELASGSRVSRRERGVRMHTGSARFDIEPARAEDGFEVEVSHGIIITLGTSFRVQQAVNHGEIELVQGRVAFQWNDGEREELGENDRLVWPRPVAASEIELDPEPDLEPEEPSRRLRKAKAKRTEPTPTPEVNPMPVGEQILDIMRRFSQLKSQRRYEEAAALLREAAARQDFSSVQRERLSFELGTLIADQLGDGAGACRHWRRHAQRFPSGVRSARVAELLASCP